MTSTGGEFTEADARRKLDELMRAHAAIWDAYLAPVTPEAGSSLAADDDWFRLATTSQLAFAGIGSAREHLYAAACLWASPAHGMALPQAYATLTRAALIGASNALWLMGPADRAERVKRTLRLGAADFMYRHKAEVAELEFVRVVTPARAPAHEKNVKDAAGFQEQVGQEWRRRFGIDGGIPRAQVPNYTQTEAVHFAYELAGKDYPGLAEDGKRRWVRLSADAHALVFQKVFRSSENGQVVEPDGDPDEAITLEDALTFRALYFTLAGPSMLYREAVKHWGLRATVPDCAKA